MQAHVRLFPEDVKVLKKIAAERGVTWQVELRLLVRRALRGTTKDFVILKETETDE